MKFTGGDPAVSRALTTMSKEIKALQKKAKEDGKNRTSPVTFAVLENGDLSYFEISAVRVGEVPP